MASNPVGSASGQACSPQVPSLRLSPALVALDANLHMVLAFASFWRRKMMLYRWLYELLSPMLKQTGIC